MNKTKYNIVILLTSLIYFNCDKPAPTELIDDNSADVEVISQDIDDEFYSNGFDSTGLVEIPLRFTNIISVSGIKSSDGRRQQGKASFAQAIFFDKNFPIRTPEGLLLGYRTRVPGTVKFNNIIAREEQYRRKFRGNSGPVDTLLGLRLVLNGGRGMHSDPFNFEYASSIRFEYIPDNSDSAIVVDIPTPQEISASVTLTGTFAERNLSILLEWNAARSENFEVVIGGIKMRDEVVPLYRVKTADDGSILIPSSLINMIPADKFKNLDFSLVRKLEFDYNSSRTEFHIISQSIYRLILESP